MLLAFHILWRPNYAPLLSTSTGSFLCGFAGNDCYLLSTSCGGQSYVILLSKSMGSFPRALLALQARAGATHPTAVNTKTFTLAMMGRRCARCEIEADVLSAVRCARTRCYPARGKPSAAGERLPRQERKTKTTTTQQRGGGDRKEKNYHYSAQRGGGGKYEK